MPKKLRSSKITEEEVIFVFEEKSKIIIPLKGDYPGNEAVIFNSKDPPVLWALYQI